MFKKKPKDKHREDNGANTRNNSSTVRTVTRTENGNSVTTRTTSVSSTKIITREERSFQIHQSSSGGSVSSFSSDRSFSNFSPRTIFDNNSFKTEPFQSDAVPFSSYGSQRRTSVPYRSPYSPITYGSYPTRSNSSTVVTRPPITSTFTPTNFTRPTTTVTTSSLAVPAVTRSTSVVPTYEHTSRKLGKALIINNINFSVHEAIQSGSVNIVEYLLKQKCLVNIPGPEYTTPLHQAASLNHTQIVKLLLSYGANKNLTDFNGLKPEDCTSNKAVRNVLKAHNSPEGGHIFKVFLPQKVVMFCHSVDDEMKRKLEVCNHIEVVNKEEINKTKLTHFVIKKSHKLSFKIMQAMLDGLQFINEDLVDSFLKQDYFINIPKQTFITNDLLNKGIQRAMMSALLKLPKLFDGVHFYIEDHTKFVEVYHLKVDKEYLTRLIRAGGGRVLNRAPAPRVTSATTCPFFASKSSMVYHCCNFIIFNENNPPGLLYGMKELKHKSSKWLIDCIVKYEITD